jgi:hypothetical protein
MSAAGFEGMRPHHTEWWGRHSGDAPTVVLRCGRDGCGDRVGEIKTDGTTTMVLRYQKIGEVPVPEPRTTAGLGEDRLLRRTGDGYVVPRRRQWPAVVSPLSGLAFVMCPTHGKLDVPPDTVADLERFVADTRHGSKRSYSIFRGSPL